MSVVRIQHDKDKPYVMLNKASIQDVNLSWRARGLLAYLISLPDDWKISVSHLKNVYQGNRKGNSRDSIYDILKELEECGYLKKEQEQKTGGLFGKVNYVVFESKQPVEKKEKPVKQAKLKNKVPLTDKPLTDKPFTVESTQTINNDKEYIYKENDINVTGQDRSFFEQDSIVSFDPQTYQFPDGSGISKQMQNAIAKYSPDDRIKLQANVFYFEDQLRKGAKPKGSYEKMLQGFIKHNYAQSMSNASRNKLYAQFVKEEYKLHKMNILKTVVQFKRSDNEPYESVSFSLPTETFEATLENYINKNK